MIRLAAVMGGGGTARLSELQFYGIWVIDCDSSCGGDGRADLVIFMSFFIDMSALSARRRFLGSELG